MDNVQNPQNPTENCYDDVQWNRSVGKFYSIDACSDYVAVEPPPPDYYEDYRTVEDDPIPPPPPSDITFGNPSQPPSDVTFGDPIPPPPPTSGQ